MLHGGEGRESNFTNSAVAKIEPCSAESSSIVKSEQKIKLKTNKIKEAKCSYVNKQYANNSKKLYSGSFKIQASPSLFTFTFMLKRKDYKEANIQKEMLRRVLQKSFPENFLIFAIHTNLS